MADLDDADATLSGQGRRTHNLIDHDQLWPGLVDGILEEIERRGKAVSRIALVRAHHRLEVRNYQVGRHGAGRRGDPLPVIGWRGHDRADVFKQLSGSIAGDRRKTAVPTCRE